MLETPMSGSLENDWPTGDDVCECESCRILYHGCRETRYCYKCLFIQRIPRAESITHISIDMTANIGLGCLALGIVLGIVIGIILM